MIETDFANSQTKMKTITAEIQFGSFSMQLTHNFSFLIHTNTRNMNKFDYCLGAEQQ